MKADASALRLIAAILGAMVSFAVVAAAIYYRLADVPVNGLFHGGPRTLTAAMGGLFGGGLAAVVALVLLLKVIGDRTRRK